MQADSCHLLGPFSYRFQMLEPPKKIINEGLHGRFSKFDLYNAILGRQNTSPDMSRVVDMCFVPYLNTIPNGDCERDGRKPKAQHVVGDSVPLAPRFTNGQLSGTA